MRSAVEPLIPAGVLQNPVVRMGTLAACFGMGTYIGLTIYLPVYFETVRGLSASQSGLALIPLMVGTVAGATISGRVMAKFDPLQAPADGRASASHASAPPSWRWFANAPVRSSPSRSCLRCISVGLGTLLPVTTVAIQNAVRPHELGTATGTANFFRSLGGAFIVAIFGAIVLGATGLAKGSMHAEGIVPGAAVANLAAVFRYVFAAACIGFALALAFIVMMPQLPLRGRSAKAAEAAFAD